MLWGEYRQKDFLLAKKAKKGTLIPEYINTPAEENKSIKQTKTRASLPRADNIKVLETKPLNRGKADKETAPIIVHIAVIGIYLKRPPNSEALQVLVLYKTAPIPIKSNPL